MTPSIPLDDLRPGTAYTFAVRGAYPLTGEFAGFLAKRGEPLVVLLIPADGVPGEVLSFPVTALRRVRRPRR